MPHFEQPITPLVASDPAYRTTYRCARRGCGLTARLLNPIDHCPRCGAQMVVIGGPQRDLNEFFAAAAEDVVAGFEALLRAA